LLGERSALCAKRVNILGSPNLSYEELGKAHWRALLKLAKTTQRFEPVRGCAMWGYALGPLEASAQMATSPRKEERKKTGEIVIIAELLRS